MLLTFRRWVSDASVSTSKAAATGPEGGVRRTLVAGPAVAQEAASCCDPLGTQLAMAATRRDVFPPGPASALCTSTTAASARCTSTTAAAAALRRPQGSGAITSRRTLVRSGQPGWRLTGSPLTRKVGSGWRGGATGSSSATRPMDLCSPVFELPVERPTSCAFAGPELETLFVFSAREGLDDNALARQPDCGRVFAISGIGLCRAPVSGLPRTNPESRAHSMRHDRPAR